VVVVVWVWVLDSSELARRKALKRWRRTGMEAATMVRAGSMKPQRTRGRELSGWVRLEGVVGVVVGLRRVLEGAYS
jgi:hypothetical protein